MDVGNAMILIDGDDRWVVVALSVTLVSACNRHRDALVVSVRPLCLIWPISTN